MESGSYNFHDCSYKFNCYSPLSVSVPFLFQFLFHSSFSFYTIILSVSVPFLFQFLYHYSFSFYSIPLSFCTVLLSISVSILFQLTAAIPLLINCYHSSFNFNFCSSSSSHFQTRWFPGCSVQSGCPDNILGYQQVYTCTVCSCNVIWTIWVCSIVDSSQLLNSLSP